MNFADYFIYDETSPSCLRWGVVIESANGRPMTSVGDVAGAMVKGKRYFSVQLHKRKYFCHKIVWKLHGLHLPEGQVLDHIDRNQFNNKVSNLRAVSQKANCENRRMSSANKTGITGVTLKESVNTLYYCATWKKDRKTKSKSFSVSRFGLLPAFAKAAAFRASMVEELNKQGASYTANHGKG